MWLICRVPSPTVPRYALGFSPLGHLCRILVRTPPPLSSPVCKVSENRANYPNGQPFSPRRGSRHYDTTRDSVDLTDRKTLNAVSRSIRNDVTLRHRSVSGTGIITVSAGSCDNV